MTLEQIETFLDLCETRSFNRTANRLGVTQSTISGRVQALEAALGRPLAIGGDAGKPSSPAQLASHYAPRATVRLMTAQQLQAGLDVLGKDARNIAVYASPGVRVMSNAVPVRRMPADAADCAQELFAVLRELDATGVKLIWVETPPDTPAWDGVRDRLQRAAA